MKTVRIAWALFLFCGIFILVGIYLLIPPTPVGGVINGTLDPGYYGFYQVDVLKAGRISGSFFDSQDEPVQIYVLDSGQYNSFKSTGNMQSLFVTEGISGTFSTTFQVPGTYYLVMRHGPGFEQSSQSLTVYYNLDGLNLTFLSTGLAAVAGGVLLGAIGRSRAEAERNAIARAQNARLFWQPPQAQQESGANVHQKVSGLPSTTITPIPADSAALLQDRLQRIEHEIQRMDVMRRDGKPVNLELFEREYTYKVEQAANIRRKLESGDSSAA